MHNKGHTKRCPRCGFDEHKYQQHPLYLEPRTILQNQYIIGITLGQGGFGTTYLGLDQRLQKKVAIKEYLPATLATRDVITAKVIPLKKQENTFHKGLQLFIDEARHLAKFDHPNIVRVINFFEANQTGYMVMDYLEGLNPEAIINQVGGNLPVKEALDIILPLLDALAEVHTKHIYHRDISIQNICILKSGIPVLIDFGAARHVVGEQSHTLDLVLKHGYSPIEQYSGRGKIGPWTDIYACGALLYLMITGKLPPAATDRFCEDILVAPIEMKIDISQSINNTIMRSLA
ncbi:MAG: serine/threonine protein kinase, partial [Proteobacteria bacterium]|nr:serine/threonine protein kinase [Pseudomonadota bacterium]